MIHDQAFGCIPIRIHNDQSEVLLVMKANGPDGAHWWGLPKGHAEEGETPVATAVRELFEETGLAGCTVDESARFTDEYEFVLDGHTVKKTVTYFVCSVPATEPVGIDLKEIIAYRWFPLGEVHEYATYDETKRLLVQVAQSLA
jgi:8-oxo-dGTP pyrophosphatase MutT (NUDIX family)